VNRSLAALLLALSLSTWAPYALAGCTIDTIPHAKRGDTITITMHVTNDGSICRLTPRVGNGQAQSVSIVEPPKSGRVEISLPSAIYWPAPGFEGEDSFVLAWFGSSFGLQQGSSNFRTLVKVEVIRGRTSERR
jgi:hypothetical protein